MKGASDDRQNIQTLYIISVEVEKDTSKRVTQFTTCMKSLTKQKRSKEKLDQLLIYKLSYGC